VAEPLGAAPLERVPDRRQAEAFAGWMMAWKFSRWISWKASR
jgi:hypothetical protein